MKWARIKDGVVQEVREDIGAAGAEYFHPRHYDAVLDVTELPDVQADMLYQNGVFLTAEKSTIATEGQAGAADTTGTVLEGDAT